MLRPCPPSRRPGALAFVAALALLAAGCAGGSATGEGDMTPVPAQPAPTEPAAGLPPPPAAEPPAAPADPALYGTWTLARAGDRVCIVELGERAGTLLAKTRNCASVELARIAFWTPTPNGLELYDFDKRPVATFTSAGPNLFEGVAQGIRVTLWR